MFYLVDLISNSLFSFLFTGFPCRRPGVHLSWLGLDGAGPSGFNRVQMLMRQLDVGEPYAQSSLEDAPWGLFSPNPSQQVGTSTSAVPRYPGASHVRSTSEAAISNLENIIAMAETVREVLPHIPDNVIFQVQQFLSKKPIPCFIAIKNASSLF